MNTRHMSSQWLHKPLANLVILIPMVCWFAFCLDIIAPALPLITDDLHVSSTLLQNSMSLFLLVCGITQLSMRKLLIKFGRRSLTLGCYITIILGCLIGTKATNITSLVMARCLQAAGSSGTLMISFLSIRDITQNVNLRSKMCSYLSTAIAMSPIIIPMLGAFILESQHWHFTFSIMMALIAMHGIFMFKLFPKNPSHEQQHQEKSSWQSLFLNHINLAYLLCSGILGGTSNFLFLSHSSYIYIVKFETSRLLYGYLFSVVGITYMLGCFLFPFASKKTSILKAIIFGHILIFLSMLLICAMNIFDVLNAATFTIFAALAHFGSGFLLTGSIIGLMSNPKLATEQVIGVYGCAKFILPAIFGWVSMTYGASLFAMSASTMILSSIASLALIPIIHLSYRGFSTSH